MIAHVHMYVAKPADGGGGGGGCWLVVGLTSVERRKDQSSQAWCSAEQLTPLHTLLF